MLHIAVDPGSSHCNKREYCEELIRIAKEAGADSIKFQLFRKEPNSLNIELNRDNFLSLLSYGKSVGIPVTASAFDEQALMLLASQDVPYIKLAYSKAHQHETVRSLLKLGKKMVVSCNEKQAHHLPDHPNLVKLYIDADSNGALYPVPWVTNFEGVFPFFDGYSDHHRGWGTALEAVKLGAKWIEKHITLEYSDSRSTPDGYLGHSLNAYEMQQFIREARAEEAKREDAPVRA